MAEENKPAKSAVKPAVSPAKPVGRSIQPANKPAAIPAKPAGKPPFRKGGKPGAEQKGGAVRFSYAVPGRVEEVIGRTGTRGEATQVRCKVLAGREQNKIIRRNVKGPVQKGDILMLRETEIEARPLNKGGRAANLN